MIDGDKIMDDVEKNLEELKDKEVIEKIFLIKEKIENTPINEWKIDALVDYIFTLCKIMDNLSDLKDYAYARAEAIGEEYKSAVRDKYIELKNGDIKVTDGMAKVLAEAGCDEIKEKEIKASHQARWLKSLYDDCDRLISFTQTKVKSQSDSFIRSNIER
jgi:hypothetical protein